jgi:transcription termination factor NusB
MTETNIATRTVDVEDTDGAIKQHLLERQKAGEDGLKLQEKVDELQAEMTKLSHHINRMKEKIDPLIKDQEKKWRVTMFDYVARVYLEDDKVKAEIINAIEDYKVFYLEKKKAALKK